MNKEDTILITGSNGMVGKVLVAKLKELGYNNLLMPKSQDLDLRDQKATDIFFKNNTISYVFHLAAKVGGIQANIKFPAEFLYDNLLISCNVIESAKKYKIKKLLNLGSSCIYPKESKQPMKEEYLLSGKLEPTNEGYAIGKIAALKLCEFYNKQYNTNFISLMPPNMYGIHDHFDSEKSHVISALISKMHKAKLDNETEVEIWGTGKARREFLYVEDTIDAIMYFMKNHNAEELMPFVNIGTNEDISIKELAELIKEITGYQGKLNFNTEKPDGMMKKLMDSSKSKILGWEAKTKLKEGLKKTYRWMTNEKN